MKILVACEHSGRVRDAFAEKGHDAISCDFKDSDVPGKHYKGDVMDILNDGFDMMIAFPPCNHLCVSGAKWFKEKQRDGRQQQGIDFFMKMVNAPIPRIAVENPVGIMSKIYKKPDQIIQPFYFGDSAQKTTCLWLKHLPKLFHNDRENLFGDPITHVERGEMFVYPNGKKYPKWAFFPENENGTFERFASETLKTSRARTFSGIANAMAEQWSILKPYRD